MTRAPSVLEEFALPSSINRGALMLDEGTVFNQNWWEDDASGGGGGGNRLRPGEFLHDQAGNRFRVYDIGGGNLRLAPVSEDGSLLAPRNQWRSPQGAFENELGQLIQTDVGGNISTTRTIPWSAWAGGDGGTGSTYHPPAWKPGELELRQRELDIAAAPPQWREGEFEQRQEEIRQRIEEINLQAQHDTAAAEQAHQNNIALLNMEMEHASEMQRERIQAEIDLSNLRHENDMIELERRIEAEKKQIIYGEIGATKRTLMQEQGAMERQLLQLGPDPLGQAAGLAGQATRGITPQQQAVGQAQAFINQPLPQASMEMSLPQLEEIMGGMGSTQPPMAGGFGMSGPIGMARGGTVKTKKGKQQSVVVGEAGKEIVTGSDFKVTPLAGKAQYGGRIGFTGKTAPAWTPQSSSPYTRFGKTAGGPDSAPPGPPGQPDIPVDPYPPPPLPWLEDPSWRPPPGWEWDPPWWWKGPQPPLEQWEAEEAAAEQSEAAIARARAAEQERLRRMAILAGLKPMYAGSPFGQVPVSGRGRFGAVTLPESIGMSPLAAMSGLGVTPQLIRAPSGNTYYIQDGMRHWIPGGGSSNVLRGFGLDPAQVVKVTHGDAVRFPPGEWFTGQGTQAAGAVSGLGGYGALGAPLVEGTTGALLMSPHKIAGIWNQLNPTQQQVALSAWKHAGGPTGFGLDPGTVMDMIQTFTPAGRGYGRRIGGVGGQF